MARKKTPLIGAELQSKVNELKEAGDLPNKTIEKIADGTYCVTKDNLIWNAVDGKIIKGSAIARLGNGGRRKTKSKIWNVSKQLDLFDNAVTPKDWQEILKNWAEHAKTDWRAAKELFETRFGKAPVRIHTLVESFDHREIKQTAMERVKERMERLKNNQVSDGDIFLKQVMTPDAAQTIDGKAEVVEQDGDKTVVKLRRKRLRSEML